jgi:hypothetical protein
MVSVVRSDFHCDAAHHAGAALLPLGHEAGVRLARSALALGVDDAVIVGLDLVQCVLGSLARSGPKKISSPVRACRAPNSPSGGEQALLSLSEFAPQFLRC